MREGTVLVACARGANDILKRIANLVAYIRDLNLRRTDFRLDLFLIVGKVLIDVRVGITTYVELTLKLGKRILNLLLERCRVLLERAIQEHTQVSRRCLEVLAVFDEQQCLEDADCHGHVSKVCLGDADGTIDLAL